MITPQLIAPKSIVVVGASDNITKPGGKVLRNLLDFKFDGVIYAVNPKNISTQGVIHKKDISEIAEVDLAILAIPAGECLNAVKKLLKIKARAFIVYTAGFSEIGIEGKGIEEQLNDLINFAGATMIGPNCIGVIQEKYKGVFTTPIPDYSKDGCELISSSGATAVFIMEAALQNGLKFSNLYSIGNASQTGVEEIMEYMDLSFDRNISPKIKLLYLEQIKNPFKFIKHATSLIQKGCKIAAIKSGYSEAGGRAASSHTGALASSDTVIRALFKKCGIVYCSSRDELIAVAGVFQSSELTGKNIAIITHAGGSAVMLTDALTSNGLEVPPFDPIETEILLAKLNPGSSVSNPIDFLATGTAAQLGEIIDFCENYNEVDGMVVVFGSPGLFNVKDVYDVLDAKMRQCKKPIFPVLPSLVNAENEIKQFLAKGHVNFPDEVNLGKALAHVYNSKKSLFEKVQLPEMDIVSIRALINSSPNGYLSAEACAELMEAAGIDLAQQLLISDSTQLEKLNDTFNYPIVMKVVGPVHKTEVGGVKLNILSLDEAIQSFNELIQIPEATSVLVQEMIEGEELYCGAAKQGDFGHVVMCGLGGIFLELLHDTASALVPVSELEVRTMIESLKGYPIIKGYRNKKGLNEDKYIDIVTRIGALVHIAPEICELDLNPIKAHAERMIAVDVRVCLDKKV